MDSILAETGNVRRFPVRDGGLTREQRFQTFVWILAEQLYSYSEGEPGEPVSTSFSSLPRSERMPYEEAAAAFLQAYRPQIGPSTLPPDATAVERVCVALATESQRIANETVVEWRYWPAGLQTRVRQAARTALHSVLNLGRG